MATSINATALDLLIVEPSSMQRKVIAQLCESLGIVSMDYADTGAQALAALSQRTPDIVISALYLPDMLGTDLVLRMRSVPAQEDVPFILVSSETRPQALDPVRQSGVCAIVPKPFTAEQLAQAINATLDMRAIEPMTDIDLDLEELKVLLVDDSPHARRCIRGVLEQLGLRHFIEAGDGTEAVGILGDTMVDLVVTDYNMPEMDGRALVEHIRQHSWQTSVPVLMVTSEQDASRLAAIEKAGVSGICDKPFDAGSVRRLLHRALAGS
ncbi:response regulator [Denitromonas iodatirespirans]|uniref:Response regulator n=1 Tax=Denitromonas iodatirespirans TaxID=2795389 RepID=A0A944DBL7_DENI1|nr:response regulator [Denitromonas iodatirespirans]MBT0962031.1 response regulator [Denitromonas iodatirespirans]